MKAKIVRLCRKCGVPIPARTKIDGRFHTTNKRKFCLVCSPFGGRNTKSDDPSRPTKPRKAVAEAAWRRCAARATQRAREFRRELIKHYGGKCLRCGYDRCTDALEFHHVDPQTKVFNLSVTNIRAYHRPAALIEAAKCVLVCANCHREIEAEQRVNRESNPNNHGSLHLGTLR